MLYIKNLSTQIITLTDLGLQIPIGDKVSVESLIVVRESQQAITKILAGEISIEDNNNEYNTTDAINYIYGKIDMGPRDRSNKLRVHQTSRKLGTMIYFTGVGDDDSDPSLVGGGTPTVHTHLVGESSTHEIYIDFNCVENETWLHEGYITWENGKLDTLSMSLVPRVVSTEASTGTFYNSYNGLIIPAAGDGIINITNDITLHNGGLIYMPPNDLGETSMAFWNADWNSTTKRFENITAAPAGDGEYNMFDTEIKFATFANTIPLLGNGFERMQSSDTDQLGNGIRLKIESVTNGDHEWSFAAMLTMHRKKTA